MQDNASLLCSFFLLFLYITQSPIYPAPFDYTATSSIPQQICTKTLCPCQIFVAKSSSGVCQHTTTRHISACNPPYLLIPYMNFSSTPFSPSGNLSLYPGRASPDGFLSFCSPPGRLSAILSIIPASAALWDASSSCTIPRTCSMHMPASACSHTFPESSKCRRRMPFT